MKDNYNSIIQAKEEITELEKVLYTLKAEQSMGADNSLQVQNLETLIGFKKAELCKAFYDYFVNL